MNRISIERMRYKNDKLSFFLVILGLVANIFYFITLYKANNNFFYSYQMGLSVVYNLIFMLITFLAAEEVKTYKRTFSVILLIIGLLQIARIFILPAAALNVEAIEVSKSVYLTIYLVISAIFLFLGAIVSFYKATILNRLLAGKIQ